MHGAYNQGVRAYINGIGRHRCPYQVGSELAKEWLYGWLDAKNEEWISPPN